MDGTPGTAAEKVTRFIEKLRAALPAEIEIVTHDERLTTVEAQAQLHAAGRNVKNSRDVIDQAAAVVILQHYMDSLATQTQEQPPLAGADD